MVLPLTAIVVMAFPRQMAVTTVSATGVPPTVFTSIVFTSPAASIVTIVSFAMPKRPWRHDDALINQWRLINRPGAFKVACRKSAIDSAWLSDRNRALGKGVPTRKEIRFVIAATKH